MKNSTLGELFWSGRVWDTESLAAHAEAVCILLPVEDVIADGILLEGAKSDPPMRLSGMRNDIENSKHEFVFPKIKNR